MQFVENNLQFEDLFAVKEEEALNAQNVSPQECPLTVGEQYKVLWERYGKSLRAWAKETRLIRADERTMQLARFGEYAGAFEEMDAGSVEYSLRKLAAEIRSILIQTAEKDFAPEGINLKIDRFDVSEKFPIEEDKLEKFDPVAIWKHLEEKYGGEYGLRLALAQTAKGFKSKFNLDNNEEIVSKGDYVVLTKRVWIDDFDKKHYKKNRLSFGCSDSIRQALNVLSEIARWAEREILQIRLLSLARTFSDCDYEVKSRQQFSAGNGEVVVITYVTNFEFRIRKDFAEQIQVFLGTFLEAEE